ncbi:hypothetical protein FACS1894105_02150 [Clostridia bacterium]|nr:hypothetical protein FACS1894105_02150 [Clostridia bacterium]
MSHKNKKKHPHNGIVITDKQIKVSEKPAESASSPKAEPEAESKTVPAAETKPIPETVTEPESKAEPIPESKPEPESKAEPVAESESKPEPKSKLGPESEPKPEIKSEPAKKTESASPFDMVKTAAVLGIITVTTALLLAVLNSFTAPVIAKLQEDDRRAAIEKFFGTVESEEDLGGNVTLVNGEGYIVSVAPKGFSGKINMLVALTLDFKVIDTKVISMSETAGQGTKVGEDNFREQFKGKGSVKAGVEVNTIGGATISSKAFIDGVNTAIETAQKAVTDAEQKSEEDTAQNDEADAEQKSEEDAAQNDEADAEQKSEEDTAQNDEADAEQNDVDGGAAE